MGEELRELVRANEAFLGEELSESAPVFLLRAEHLVQCLLRE